MLLLEISLLLLVDVTQYDFGLHLIGRVCIWLFCPRLLRNLRVIVQKKMKRAFALKGIAALYGFPSSHITSPYVGGKRALPTLHKINHQVIKPIVIKPLMWLVIKPLPAIMD